jgi:hypothetical protein
MAVLFDCHSSVIAVCCFKEVFTVRNNLQHQLRQQQLKPREITHIRMHKHIHKKHIHRENITSDGLPN